MAEDDVSVGEQRERERARSKPDMLEAVAAGKLKLTAGTAPFIARKLQEQLSSDKVNSDNVNKEDKRNNYIAERLKEFGIDIKGQTEATTAKANNSQTQSIATPEKAKQEDPLKSINPINMQKINKEMIKLRELKTSAPEYADVFAEMLEKDLAKKGKEGFGLSETQINAIKSQNKDLFPKKRKETDLSNADNEKKVESHKNNANENAQQKAIERYIKEKSRERK